MYLIFKSLKDWFAKEEGLEEKYNACFTFLENAANEFVQTQKEAIYKLTKKKIKLSLSEIRLRQAIIDAFDDLLRLTKFHLTDDPNTIKEMSYITYWIMKHKVIQLETEEIIFDSRLKSIVKARLLFLNEYFSIKLLMNAVYPANKEIADRRNFKELAEKQFNLYKRYLLYYLVYRLDSPKSLEAIMLGTTLIPTLQEDESIWALMNLQDEEE